MIYKYTIKFKILFYLFDIAISLVDIFLKPALSFNIWIGSLNNIPNAIKAEESVLNLAMSQSDEVKARIDKCIEFNFLLIKNIIWMFIIILVTYWNLLYLKRLRKTCKY